MRVRGVNIGGWLLMEGYILGGRNISEIRFKNKFKEIFGERELEEFEREFRDNFICEEDFAKIAKLGGNCIRVPFNHKLFGEENKPEERKKGEDYFRKVFAWAEKYGLKVILDLHAAVGSQNCDWHSDSEGEALLWKEEIWQEKTCLLWEFIVERFKDEEALFGYDVLNEPVVDNVALLKDFYKKLVKRIKAIDKKHTIILEGNLWAQKIDFLRDLVEENIMVSIHTYHPLSFTFNFVPGLRYPGKIDGVFWDKDRLYKYLEPYYRFSQENKVEILVGEFGLNWRDSFYGEALYLTQILEIFEEFNFSYTYWTYKAIKGYTFPDGIYQYLPNSKYVKREGPVQGWENYFQWWKKEKAGIISFWRGENYSPNQGVIDILEAFLNKR
ncbi:MAG: hypothetical protein B6D55_01295 [Candidatus Omnitrophica bacterium 4484_70.2]|nr:MAG: hypothetical protein B6D55_01295 [Candidatus Omnitrophica bacterium 4484_70.2]